MSQLPSSIFGTQAYSLSNSRFLHTVAGVIFDACSPRQSKRAAAKAAFATLLQKMLSTNIRFVSRATYRTFSSRLGQRSVSQFQIPCYSGFDHMRQYSLSLYILLVNAEFGQ